MSLMLPTWEVEMGGVERRSAEFSARAHWELSTSITTNHLLAIISLANTLMSLNNASFVAEQERSRKLMRLNGEQIYKLKFSKVVHC